MRFPHWVIVTVTPPHHAAVRFWLPALAAAAAAGCAGGSGGPTSTPSATSSPTTEVSGTTSPLPTTPSTTPSATLATIVVATPVAGDTVRVPFTVSGTADVFEAQFVLDVLDESGSVVVHQLVTATSGSGTRGAYTTTVATGYRGPATLDVYDISGRGDKIDDIQIPIVIGA